MRIDTPANAGMETNKIGVNKQCITQRDERSIASLSEINCTFGIALLP
ncbi:hypothetical protein BFV95_3958 [Alteromonas macleodii]|uniref:Uncharacterized protein n=1 Tax=Alteromonas macleodii TaxID=28108 RepID=A0AB36FPB6_ALTMA|nr:hypothetical protein BFV95_3958 [Alteromonas macleodii]